MRKDRVFTIDPESAKDFDDALSIKKNEDGTYDVSVHIADVSHFVKPNTALDRDARKRATSVYLIQRAVPMLPPALCEQICSLVPHQERLAFTVTFTMTDDAKITKKRFEKTIIKYVFTTTVNLIRFFSVLTNLGLKLIELIPICLFHKVICLQEVLVFVDKFLFNKKLTLEKDFDEGYTLNDVHNEMAHVAAVK